MRRWLEPAESATSICEDFQKIMFAIMQAPCIAHHAHTEFIAKLETQKFQNSSTASLAWLAEHPLSKREVVGSNPTRGLMDVASG